MYHEESGDAFVVFDSKKQKAATAERCYKERAERRKGSGGSGGSPATRLFWGRTLENIKLKFKLNFMKTMTMLEFRKDARKALAAVQRGERLLLTYRGRPVAQLTPVREVPRTLPEHDPLRRLEAFSVDGPATRLSNEEIDRTVYGT